MKGKMKKTMVFFTSLAVSLFFLAISSQIIMAPSVDPENTNPLGIEYIGDNMIHMWNELDDYYINTTGFQISYNHTQPWTHNVFCVWVKLPNGNWIRRCTDGMDWNWNYKTDNQTFVELNGTTTYSEGPYRATIRIVYKLGSYDTALNFSGGFRNTGKDINDFYFGWIFKDINVSGDWQNDFLVLNMTTEPVYVNLSKDINREITENDITERYIEFFDNNTKDWVDVGWDEYGYKQNASGDFQYNANFILNASSDIFPGQVNTPVALGVHGKEVLSGTTVWTNFWWGDATKQEYSVLLREFEEWLDFIKNKIDYSVSTGTQYNFSDIYFDIKLLPNGTVIMDEKFDDNARKNLGNSSVFHAVSALPKITCFEYFRTPSFNYSSVICPNESLDDAIERFAKYEFENVTDEEWQDMLYAHIIPIRMDGQKGELVRYNVNSVLDWNAMKSVLRVNPNKMSSFMEKQDQIGSIYTVADFEFSTDCMKFLLPRFADLTLNVTMPTAIASYSLGDYPEIVLESHYENDGKTLIAEIMSYPCCGISDMPIQWAEVCV